MFLNTEEEIKNWLYENTKCNKVDFLNNMFYFTQENDQLIVNVKTNFYLQHINQDLKELPIKFGIIEGHFDIDGFKLESFKGFPKIINGNLIAPNANFKFGKDWSVEYIEGYINLCGKNCELKNLDFLENTKFEEIIVKIGNSIFEDDIIPEDYKKITKDNRIEYKKLMKLIKLNKKIDIEMDNYLDSFDNELEKEIK